MFYAETIGGKKVYPSAQALEKSSQKIILNDVNLMPFAYKF